MKALRDVVKEVIADAIDLDPYTLQTATLAAVPAKDRAAAFEQALPAFIRAMIVETRPTVRRPANAGPEPIALPPGGNISHKVAAVRDAWRRELDAIYATPDGNKRLRDFTVTDLTNLAATCRDLARANTVKADRWERLALLVDAEGVKTLGDLDEDTLSAALA